jgi:hypothetical protein
LFAEGGIGSPEKGGGRYVEDCPVEGFVELGIPVVEEVVVDEVTTVAEAVVKVD